VIRPPRLRPGDRVAALTLSWGGPGTYPHRYEAGTRQLRDAFGLEVVELPHTMASPAASPEERADDLHRAFADPDIAGIVSSIGGDDSIRVLPHLDLDLIAANPKVVLGYSDTTILHMALRRAGLVSFYGPAIMAGFAENAGLDDYLVDGVRRMLMEPAAPLDWAPNEDGWTAEEPDWADPDTQERRRARTPSDGWRWHGGECRDGPVVAGCIEVLDWLRGTAWWPNLDAAVLVLETSEEEPPPDLVSRFLRVLALTGELHRLSAIVLGRPGGARLPVTEHATYDNAILRVVREEQRLDDLPVVSGVDIGHTDPMWTVPQGVRLRVDPAEQRLTFLEVGVV
jgi:muramoyltetrapeptide carboxypeptidase LdcA involved in peptidoglycan recycling